MSPIILQISRDLDGSELEGRPNIFDNCDSLMDYYGTYFSEGFKCIFSVSGANNEEGICKFSWIFVIGYVVSLATMQLSLTHLMIQKQNRYTKVTFSMMVPLTFIAFGLGITTMLKFDLENKLFALTLVEGIAMVIAAIGVFLFNWYEEKP